MQFCELFVKGHAKMIPKVQKVIDANNVKIQLTINLPFSGNSSKAELKKKTISMNKYQIYNSVKYL